HAKGKAMTVDLNEVTFGVEFEVTLPASSRIAVGGYHAGVPVADLPTGWNAQRDSSIQAERGFYGVEIVSPILKGIDGIRQIQTVCKWMKEKGAKVNGSTGFHVHVGWAGDQDALRRLAFFVSNFEKAIFAATGTKARERSAFCRPVKTDRALV